MSKACRGSTFYFTGVFRQGTKRDESEEFPKLSGLSVLVVDDNTTHGRILQEMLENRGMSVETAGGGREAIQALQKIAAAHRSLPLVISDVHMPDVDGYMLARHYAITRSMTNDAA